MSIIKTTKGLFQFKQHLLYPGCHVINREVAFENLKLINEILTSESVFWQVAWGTLLGIVRDNDFIAWDEDVDIVILAEEEEKFRNILWDLKKKDFNLIRYERGGLYSVSRKGEYTDFYVLKKASGEIRYTLDGGYLLEKQIKDTIEMDFKGLQLYIPREYDNLLTFYYGDWRTPKKHFSEDLSLTKKLKVLLNYYSRLYLPDFLYFRVLKKHRTAGLKAFVEKVADHGIELYETPEIQL